jgi:phosphoribosylglycinamide formyltransferase-1
MKLEKMKKTKWAFLISLWGRSAYHALEAYEKGLMPNVEVCILIYEKEPSGALDKAISLGIPTLKMVRNVEETRNQYQHRICEELLKKEIDYIFLLGFEHIIRQELLDNFPNRIINVHPSLLPSFKGTNAIYQALNYGSKISGVTTHIIDGKIDEGEILFQEPIKISKEDTFETLDPKFLEVGKQIILDTINSLSFA